MTPVTGHRPYLAMLAAAALWGAAAGVIAGIGAGGLAAAAIVDLVAAACLLALAPRGEIWRSQWTH